MTVSELPVGKYRFEIKVVHGEVVKKEKLSLEVKDDTYVVPVDA